MKIHVDEQRFTPRVPQLGGRVDGFVVSTLLPGSSSPSSSPGQRHCAVF